MSVQVRTLEGDKRQDEQRERERRAFRREMAFGIAFSVISAGGMLLIAILNGVS